ncbi:hypothetical protein E1301_Tti015344 [Triplophysa tibetana]|uniref:C-type lectin domain-containing protein n=1 Tax=Triplophysa tibetana TaxID=1572043 RepID=A0A5A9PTJ9_9TELE|nr:hypothetical protein E1301_Tti015344 [Triplophysa tibetana]
MEGHLFQISLLLGVLCSQGFQGRYVLIQTNKNWDEAQAFCRQNHLHLATFYNEIDWDNFREMMSASKVASRVWLGLYVDFNTWRWSYQNQNLTLTKWSSGEPNNAGGSEECGVMLKYGKNIMWNDAHCLVNLSCVCYHAETNRFIHVSDQQRTWREAQLYCRELYTDLATIRDADDHDQIINLRTENLYTWIGLFRDSWMWSDGTAVSSTSVGRVNANDATEACGLADSQGRTEDAACSLLLPFICSQGQRRQIVRFEVKSNRSIENDAEIQALIFQQIHEELLHRGMAASTKATWRVQTNGSLFRKRDHVREREPSLDLTLNLNETCHQTVVL